MFCPKCGSFLISKGGKMVCSSCGPVQIEGKIKEKSTVLKKEVPMIKADMEVLPKTKEECPKCGHKEAFYWMIQTRAADEAPTRFYRCVKCGHSWRAYS